MSGFFDPATTEDAEYNRTAAELERAQETIADLLKALEEARHKAENEPDWEAALIEIADTCRAAISRATPGTGAKE